MTVRVTFLALLAAALAAAPASAAEPVPLLASDSVQSVAIAGPDVIVSGNRPLGTVRVDALPTGSGPARPLLRTAPRGEGWDAFTAVAASPQRVALVTLLLAPRGAIVSQLYIGAPSGPLALVEQVRSGSGWEPDDVAVDGDRVLVLEENGEDTRLRLLAPGAAPRVVPVTSPVTGYFDFSGRRVAFESGERVVLADLATGARLLSARHDSAFSLDVAADGRIVTDGDDVGVYTIMPSGLRQGVPDGEFLENPHFAGSSIAAVEETPSGHDRPVVLAPDVIHPRAIGLPSLTIELVDADDRGVAWIANGCVLYATLDAVAPAEPPRGPCARAEVAVDNTSFTLRGRRLRLVADCIAATAAGCGGTVTARDPGIVGRGAFHAAAGARQRFTMRFTRRSARRIRRAVRHDLDPFLDVTIRLTGGPPDRDNTGLLIDKVRSRRDRSAARRSAARDPRRFVVNGAGRANSAGGGGRPPRPRCAYARSASRGSATRARWRSSRP
jgi:hypothetical protein